jgi:hypothetical protein
MAERIGVCAGCGARFRVPESFTGSAAKCKKCGGVVNIMDAASASARAPEAPARAPAPSARPSLRGSRAAAEEEGEEAAPRPHGAGRRGERGRARRGAAEKKPTNPMVLVGAGVGVVAVGALAFFLMSGDDEERTTDPGATNTANAASGTTSDGGAAAPNAGPPPAPAGGAPAPDPNSKVAPPADPAGGAAPPADATAGGDPPAAPPGEGGSGGEKKDIDAAGTGEVKTKFEFQALPKAPGTTDTEWNEMVAIAEGLQSSGRARKRALDKLLPYSMKAVPIAINSLNGLDLTDSKQWMDAFEMVTFIQDRLTADTIKIPYHGDFSDEPEEIKRAHKVLTSMLEYWTLQTSDDYRWEQLLKKHEELKAKGPPKDDGGS